MPASTRPCSHGHEKTVHPFTSKYLEAELTGDSGQVGFQPIKANRARYCPNQLVIWLLNGKKYLLMTLASGEGKEARQKNFQTELPGLWSSGLREETACGTQEQTLMGWLFLMSVRWPARASIRVYPSLSCSDPRTVGCEEGRLRACSLQTGLQITVAFTALINWIGTYCLVFTA